MLSLIVFMVGYLIRKKPYQAFHSLTHQRNARWVFFAMLAYFPLSIGGLMIWGKKSDPVNNFFLGLVFAIRSGEWYPEISALCHHGGFANYP